MTTDAANNKVTVMDVELRECNDKLILSMDRESRHAIAASHLSEAVVEAIEHIESRVLSNDERPRGAMTPSHLLRRLVTVYKILNRGHRLSATKPETDIPLMRLGPGGDYITDIMEDDV